MAVSVSSSTMVTIIVATRMTTITKMVRPTKNTLSTGSLHLVQSKLLVRHVPLTHTEPDGKKYKSTGLELGKYTGKYTT